MTGTDISTVSMRTTLTELALVNQCHRTARAAEIVGAGRADDSAPHNDDVSFQLITPIGIRVGVGQSNFKIGDAIAWNKGKNIVANFVI